MSEVEKFGIAGGLISSFALFAALADFANRGGGGTFPACDSKQAREDFGLVMNGSPNAPHFGPTMIDLRNIKTASSSSTSESCEARVVLSDESQIDYVFHFDVENNRVFIHIKPAATAE